MQQKITPFLLLVGKAREAVDHYVSIFANSRVLKSSDMAIEFELEGQKLIALNLGPEVGFTEAISLHVDCATQDDVDELWDKLSDGGEPGRCGWLKDRFGLSWQVVPTGLADMLQDPDPERSKRVVDAMLPMGKLDIGRLRRAYEGR